MLTKLRIILADILKVIGHSWDLDQQRSGTELILINFIVWDTTAGDIMHEFAETIHPLFRA